MKNAVISALATYIFYTDFCEVKLVWTIPIVFGLILFVLVWIEEDLVNEYKRSTERGKKLKRNIRRAMKTEDGANDTVNLCPGRADLNACHR